MLSQARAGHVASRGGKSGLSYKPIFPQPLCLSKQHKCSEEPEAHASGACLLLCLIALQHWAETRALEFGIFFGAVHS